MSGRLLRTIITMIWILGFVIHIKAENEEVAVQEFINVLLKKQKGDNFQYWEGMGKQPPGGYLFKFFADITDDGKPELFLSSSLNAWRVNASWWVFMQIDDKYKLVASEVIFHPAGGFYVTNKNRLTEINKAYSDLRANSGRVHHWTFDSNGNNSQYNFRDFSPDELSMVATNENEGEDWEPKMKLGRLVETKEVEKILLGIYMRNPNTSWTPYNREYSPDYQYLDPADTNAIKQVENFTPQEAQQLIEKPENKNENQTINETTTPTTSIPQNNQNNQISKITSFNNWPLIGWIGLGAVVVGLATYFLIKK